MSPYLKTTLDVCDDFKLTAAPKLFARQAEVQRNGYFSMF